MIIGIYLDWSLIFLIIIIIISDCELFCFPGFVDMF